MRGPGAVGTTAIECKAITPLVLVDIQKASMIKRCCRLTEGHEFSRLAALTHTSDFDLVVIETCL